jgi:hypothetical protein
MNHTHKIGLNIDSLIIGCRDCNITINPLIAMDCLELEYGVDEGMLAWKELRYYRDQFKIAKKQGARIERKDRFWIPSEDLNVEVCYY